MMDCIMGMNRFLKENYPNTVAISTDELGNNSEESMPEMLRNYKSIEISKEMKKILEFKTLSQVREYIKDNINKHKAK